MINRPAMQLDFNVQTASNNSSMQSGTATPVRHWIEVLDDSLA